MPLYAPPKNVKPWGNVRRNNCGTYLARSTVQQVTAA